MSKKPTGGPVEEMGLRDYFAAKAMQGLIASEVHASMDEFVTRAYAIADAMLEERK